MVCNHIRISKCKNIFPQNYTPKWTKEVFEIKSVKDTSPWTDVIEDLNGEIIGALYKQELYKTKL